MTFRFVLTLFLMVPAAFAQKFQSDDPMPSDNDASMDASKVSKHKLNDYYDYLLHTFGRPGNRAKRPAMNVNSLGEVPDSSWFQNRHGMSRMSFTALARGPNTGDGPETTETWLVIQAKTEGITPGFRIRDSRGDVYFIKFDPPENQELATAAEVISTKFFHAMGYNVPENYITFFNRSRLSIDSKAQITDERGRTRNLTDKDLDAILKRVHRSSDGLYRAVASKLLPGVPLGPFQYFGTRPDDPNDIFPHEHRRELRGLRIFSSWLNHDDSRAINSLDMLTGDPGHRYVKHYLIDFGSTLGSGSVGPQKPRAGWEYTWEPRATIGRIAGLGLWDREWIRVKYPKYPAIGRLESVHFSPEDWKPEYPNPAFDNTLNDDGYWAAKIVMSFSDEDIRAIVKTGQISDPEAEAYLVRTLIERRDKVGRYWLTRLSSLDQFQLVGNELKFTHFASEYDFAGRPPYRLTWFAFDNNTGERRAIASPAAFEGDGYMLAEIASSEGTVDVYLRRSGGYPEVVGVER